MTRQDRLCKANILIGVIASCGREFFRHDNRVAHFKFNNQKRIFFRDDYSNKLIYTHKKGRWKGFTHGGTLKSLIEKLRDYIKDGTKLNPKVFGPWPDHICRGDLWGYRRDMVQVRKAAVLLGIV